VIHHRGGHAAHPGLGFLDLFGIAAGAGGTQFLAQGVRVGYGTWRQLSQIHRGDPLGNLVIIAKGQQRLAKRGRVQRVPFAQGGLHRQGIGAVVFVDIGNALVEIVHYAQVDRFAGGAGQLAHLAVADAQQVLLPAQDARTQTEQLQRQRVFLGLGVLLDIAEVQHGLQKPVGGGLRGHRPLRDLGQAGATLLGQRFEHGKDLQHRGGILGFLGLVCHGRSFIFGTSF